MNLLSAVRSLLIRLFARPTRPDDQQGDHLAAVTAPHGPRPRKGGAHAPLPKVDEEVLR
ncbi:hypothetical protein [Deinococcus detaillensis]|uniref:hypothetical protein n=1 Tax=Deinococcus detaillensis TaxID=2592048 RepID=UPI00163D52D1|nr:hypothetical protein [Deinococcus detaillensis]